MTPRVLFHTTSGLFPGVRDPECGLQQRALLIATARDTILFTPKGVDEQTICDEIVWLNSMGLGPSADKVIMITPCNLHRVDNGRALTQTQVRRLQGKIAEVYAHVSFDDVLYVEAHRLGLNIRGPSQELSRRANSKAFFQECGQSDPSLGIPQGLVVEREDVRATLAGFLSRHKPVHLKPTDAATGQGHQSNIRSIRDLQTLDPRFPLWVMQQSIERRADASVQFVYQSGRVTKTLLTNQETTPQGHHTGNAMRQDVDTAKAEDAKSRVRRLVEEHYAFMPDGAGSVDLVLDDKRAWLVEMNWRVTSPAYAIELLERLYDHVVPFEMHGFHVMPDMRGRDLTAHFASVMYTAGATQGFIPFCFLPQHGFCYGLTFAQSASALVAIYSHAQSLQRSLSKT